jgi:hypothetical protein
MALELGGWALLSGTIMASFGAALIAFSTLRGAGANAVGIIALIMILVGLRLMAGGWFGGGGRRNA